MADGPIIAQPGMIFPAGPLPITFPAKAAKADPKREYLSGGRRLHFPGTGYSTIAAHADEAAARFGPDLWELMDSEPTVSATLTTLAASVVADGVQFYPAGQDDPGGGGVDEGLADEITAYCDRVAGDPALDLNDTLFRWVRATLKLGVKLIEQTFDLPGGGPDAGRLVPASLKIRPNWAWSFVMDPHGNLVGIVGAVPQISDSAGATTTPRILPREKFAILTFRHEDDDPRGQSALLPAYTPWDEKVKLPGERWKFLSRFGTPTWVGITAPDALDVPVKDASGAETGRFITAQESMYNSLVAIANATAVVGPAGSAFQCVEPKSDGAAFRLAADDCRREIVFAILCQIRATLESQYGSRADSEAGQDILGTVVRALKHWVAGAVRRDLVRTWVKLNWGEEAARRLTPHVTLGRTEHQDYSRDIRADSEAWAKGLYFESMRPQLLAKYGWRVPRDPGPPSGPVLPAGSGLGDPSSEPAPADPAVPKPRP